MLNSNENRRQFLDREFKAAGIEVPENLPDWLEIEDDELFRELVEICREILEEDEILDLLDQGNLQDGLGLVFTFLLSKGIDPEGYLIMKDFLE